MAEANAAVPAQIRATGPIIGVVVHGRGAVVTRRLDVEAPLPTDAVDVVVNDITPLADPGSIRVTLPAGGRALVGVNARLHIPLEDSGPGESLERVEGLARRIDRLRGRYKRLEERAQRLRQFNPAPIGRRAVETDGPVQRVQHAMAMAKVVRDTIASIEDRMFQVSQTLEELKKERDEAALEDAQTPSGDRMGEGHPSRVFEMRLAAGEETSIEGAEISYVVPYAAKWWPLYSLRLTDGGAAATLTMEALVAQRTGEDWSGVPIGLSTSEIVFDATLPRLPSLRIGKVQPPERRGFREPPDGTDRLFQGYDAFMGRLEPESRIGGRGAAKTVREESVRETQNLIDDGEFDEVWEEASFDSPASASFGAAPMPAQSAPGGGLSEDTNAFSRVQASMQASAPRKKLKATRSRSTSSIMPDEASPLGGEGGGGLAPMESPPSANDPGGDWLRFDSLVLAGPKSPHRGNLRVRREADETMTSELYDAQKSARRMNLVDPAVSRGMFDYRYDSDGTVRIPADGKLHRISLHEEAAPSTLVWRCVPAENPAVYREAKLENPFDSPLLSGPVDVYSEGQLVTTTAIDRVDSGGSMRVGLGIDERIRVARNVRMREESAGLLGGKRELIHDVSIELRSGLGFEAQVQVVDRLPVTNDDHVDVELQASEPTPREYDQSALGSPIKGGMEWRVTVPPGGRSEVEYRYQITLRSKDELVGGNRRG